MSISTGGGGAARGKGKHSLRVAYMTVDEVCACVLTDKMGVLILKWSAQSDRLALLPTSISVISADTSLSTHSVYRCRSVCFLFPIHSQTCVRNPRHKVKAGGSEALT